MKRAAIHILIQLYFNTSRTKFFVIYYSSCKKIIITARKGDTAHTHQNRNKRKNIYISYFIVYMQKSEVKESYFRNYGSVFILVVTKMISTKHY